MGTVSNLPTDEHHAVGMALLVAAVIAQREFYSLDEFLAMAELAHNTISERKNDQGH